MEAQEPAPCSALGRALAVCRAKGWTILAGRSCTCTCTCPRWLVAGSPALLLFSIGSGAARMAEWKQELWDATSIGVPHADSQCNDVIILGFMVAQFVAEFRHQASLPSPSTPTPSSATSPLVVAHCHEWMGAVALVMLRVWRTDVATVFTTHATLLGRHLCAANIDFYNNLGSFNMDLEAGRRGIYHRYCLERAAAHLAHVFTTVSDITAEEATHLLGRTPDIVTPNGLNVARTVGPSEVQGLHNTYRCVRPHQELPSPSFLRSPPSPRRRIEQFVVGHFHGHMDFALENTLFIFTSGRYEFHNKGGDVFIEALARWARL